MIAAFRAWLFRPMLDELETRHQSELDEMKGVIAQRQMEAYALGKEQGIAIGEQRGQLQMAAEINRVIDERRPLIPEVTVEDVKKAKKRIVH